MSTDEILAAIAALPDDERAMLMEALMPPAEEPEAPEVEVEQSADMPAEERAEAADQPIAMQRGLSITAATAAAAGATGTIDSVMLARGLAADAFVDALVERGVIIPAQRSIWVRSYMADPEATKASAPNARAVYVPKGSAQKPAPKADLSRMDKRAIEAHIRKVAAERGADYLTVRGEFAADPRVRKTLEARA